MKVTGLVATVAILTLAVPASRAMAQNVTLAPVPEGLVATYRFNEPVSRFAFAAPRTVRSDWVSQTPRVALDPMGLSIGAGIDRVSVLIRPDSTEVDRGYIALVRLGEGFILYGPALTGEGQSLTLNAELPEGWILAPGSGGDGYVYIGPASSVNLLSSGAGTIMAPDLFPDLRDTTVGAFADAMAFYGARFGRPAKAPVLAVTAQGAGPASFRGDVTDTGVISTRFNGDGWREPDADALSDVVRFIFHETGHAWNSHTARPAEGSPWLHEGGAEYMAMVAAVSTGHLTEAQARESLSGRLTACRRRLETYPDVSARMQSGSAVYDCGTLIQWLADMELRRESDGQRSILDVWSTFISRAATGDGVYGPADFRAALKSDSAIEVLFDAPPAERWPELGQRLTDLGVHWENRPSRRDYLVGALFHLNALSCAAGAATGFFVRDGDYIEMDNDQTCGPLSGSAALSSIESLNPVDQPQATFEAIQDRCRDGMAIRIVLKSSDKEIAIPCSRPLSTPNAYAVTNAPDLRL